MVKINIREIDINEKIYYKYDNYIGFINGDNGMCHV